MTTIMTMITTIIITMKARRKNSLESRGFRMSGPRPIYGREHPLILS